jgi:hypothetical protein
MPTFALRHRRKTDGDQRSADFPVEKKVIPWPTAQSNKIAVPAIAHVQIAIEDQVYAEELRCLLEEDNKHRAYFVHRPTLTIDGLVVLDETTVGHVGEVQETDALRYIVLCKKSADPDKLWDTGIRWVVPAEYPPNLV